MHRNITFISSKVFLLCLVYPAIILKKLHDQRNFFPWHIQNITLYITSPQNYYHKTVNKLIGLERKYMGKHQACYLTWKFLIILIYLHLVFLELETHQCQLDFKLHDENNFYMSFPSFSGTHRSFYIDVCHDIDNKSLSICFFNASHCL